MARGVDEVITAIDTAARWWADQLRGTTHQTGDAVTTMARSLLPRDKPTAHQIGTFEDVLWHEIAANMGPYLILDCDYEPKEGSPLDVACQAAGISTDLLPCKTVMWIEGDTVEVSHGYGAKPVRLVQQPPAE